MNNINDNYDINNIYLDIIESEYGGEIISCLDTITKLILQRYLFIIYKKISNQINFSKFISEYIETKNNLITLSKINNDDSNKYDLDEFIYEKKLEALSITFKNNRYHDIFHYMKVKIILDYYLFIQ